MKNRPYVRQYEMDSLEGWNAVIDLPNYPKGGTKSEKCQFTKAFVRNNPQYIFGRTAVEKDRLSYVYKEREKDHLTPFILDDFTTILSHIKIPPLEHEETLANLYITAIKRGAAENEELKLRLAELETENKYLRNEIQVMKEAKQEADLRASQFEKLLANGTKTLSEKERKYLTNPGKSLTLTAKKEW